MVCKSATFSRSKNPPDGQRPRGAGPAAAAATDKSHKHRLLNVTCIEIKKHEPILASALVQYPPQQQQNQQPQQQQRQPQPYQRLASINNNNINDNDVNNNLQQQHQRQQRRQQREQQQPP